MRLFQNYPLASNIGRLIVFVAFVSLLSPTVDAQKVSREEMLKEAGRMMTEAERKLAVAHYQQTPGDRKLVVEAEQGVKESLEKAIKLWREAGDDARLVVAVEELTRLYSVRGEYEEAVNQLTLEVEYWKSRGDVDRQVRMLSLLGTRQWQMRRDKESIETLERVVSISETDRRYLAQQNALGQLAIVYDRVGRKKDAEAAREKSQQLSDLTIDRSVPTPAPKSPAAIIPTQWIDLPLAPLASEYRQINGENQAVLVNRSPKIVQGMTTGCVLRDGEKTKILHALAGVYMTHSGWDPGSTFNTFITLNGPMNRWTDEKMSCEGTGKMAVIEVRFSDGTIWKADTPNSGTP